MDYAAGLAKRGSDRAFRVVANGQAALWILDSAKRLQVRLMVCTDMSESGHHHVAATLLVGLRSYYNGGSCRYGRALERPSGICRPMLALFAFSHQS